MNTADRVRAARRDRLLALIAAQRERLAQDAEPLRRRLAIVDQGLQAVRYVRQHPLLLAGAGALLLLTRPRGAVAWLRRGWMGWLLLRRTR
jgi:hypothetical protein